MDFNLNGKERTFEFLQELQALPLDRKIQLTQTRIIEFYGHFNGQVAVNFSGGKDSTVLLDIARKTFPDIPAVFCNTGLEFPEIVQFVKSFDNIDIIRPEVTFKQAIKTAGWLFPSKEMAKHFEAARRGVPYGIKMLSGGYAETARHPERVFKYTKERFEKWLPLLHAPFKYSDKCCRIMKKNPFHKYQRETGRYPIVATMAGESFLREQSWKRSGCNAYDSRYPRSAPMSFWLEKDVIEYIQRFNLPYCSVYGDIKDGKFTGETRTGCIFCLAGVHLEKYNRFKRMKRTHPKLWRYCMKPESEGGLGLAEVLDWINANLKIGYMPMDYGQNDLYLEEVSDEEQD